MNGMSDGMNDTGNIGDMNDMKDRSDITIWSMDSYYYYDVFVYVLKNESADLFGSACWSPVPFAQMTICPYAPYAQCLCPYARMYDYMPICPYGPDRMII